MKPINLLRAPHPTERKERGRFYTGRVLPCLASVVVLVVFGAGALHLRGLDRAIQAHQVSLSEVIEQSPSLLLLESARDTKQAKLAAARRVQNPLTPDVALSLLSQTLPNGVTLSELTLTTETSARPIGRGRSEEPPGSAAAAHPRVSLSLRGWADDELTVAETLERINGVSVLGEARIVASHPDDAELGHRHVFLIASSAEWLLTERALSQTGAQP